MQKHCIWHVPFGGGVIGHNEGCISWTALRDLDLPQSVVEFEGDCQISSLTMTGLGYIW